jgi:hypothetical protein
MQTYGSGFDLCLGRLDAFKTSTINEKLFSLIVLIFL